MTRDQVVRLQMVREAALAFAQVVVMTAPKSGTVMLADGQVEPYLTADETANAIDRIEEAMFWANAAIARST